MSKDRKTSDSAGIDDERALELHGRGMRDAELAQALGIPKAAVVEWRREHGLHANRIAVWNTERAMELYRNRASDAQIAEELSKAGASVSAAAVGAWRRQQGLPANSSWVWKRGAEDAAPEKPAEPQRPLRQPIQLGPFAPGAAEEEARRREQRREQKKRTHLVAIPTTRHEDVYEETVPGRRRRRQKSRVRSALPLTGVYQSPSGAGDGMLPLGFLDESSDPEQDIVYVMAALIHLCRIQFDWADKDVREHLDAVAFTESLVSDIETAAKSSFQQDMSTLFGEFPDLEPDPDDGGQQGQGKKKRTRKKRR